MIYQEKLQVTLPSKVEGGESWESSASARRSHPQSNSNQMPIGYTPEAAHNMPLSVAGATDPSDGLYAGSLNAGFIKRPMSPMEDQPTQEYEAAFYDDEGGFVMRANYLDRL